MLKLVAIVVAVVAGYSFAAAVSATPANSQGLTGNKLHEFCTNNQMDAFCSGYIIGAADVLSTLSTKRSCVPQGVNGEQVRDVVKRFLRLNPQVRHEPGAQVVAMALSDAFPCKASN